MTDQAAAIFRFASAPRPLYLFGVGLDLLDTPVLTIDLDAVERNIARMQSYCDEHGFALRPHIKTHKFP